MEPTAAGPAGGAGAAGTLSRLDYKRTRLWRSCVWQVNDEYWEFTYHVRSGISWRRGRRWSPFDFANGSWGIQDELTYCLLVPEKELEPLWRKLLCDPTAFIVEQVLA